MKRLSGIVLCILIGSIGCVSSIVPQETMLLRQTRYGEMEKTMEARITDMSSASHMDLFYLCTAYSKTKRYDKLFPCVEHLKKAEVKESRSWMVVNYPGMPSMMLAEAWMELGDYDKAVVNAERAYQLSQSPATNPHYKVWAPTTAGLCRALSGNRRGAEQIAAELETLDVAYNTRLVTSDRYMGLAKIYMALGNYQKSLQTIQMVTGQLTTAFDEMLLGKDVNMFWEMPKLYMLAKSSLETGDYTNAKTTYDRLLQMPQTKQNGGLYWLILFDRGRIAEVEGQSASAIDYYRRAIDIIEQQRSTIDTEVSKIGFAGDKQIVYSRIISALFEKAQYEEAFEYAERAKSRALVDILAARDHFSLTVGDTDQTNALIAELKAVETEAQVQDDTRTADQASRQRAVLVDIKENLRNTDPEIASLISVTPPDVQEIQKLLPPGETLLEYYGAGEKWFAFVVTREGVTGVPLDGTGLDQAVERFREQIMVTDSNKYQTEGRRLYKRLFQPIAPMIASGNLTVVPHGALHYLPFNALQRQDQFLIDRHHIRILPSAGVMKFLKSNRGVTGGNVIAFGNPDLGDPKYDLPWAQKEARIVAGTQPNSRFLVRKNATETAVKRYGSQFRHIHFATHGTFQSKTPLSSGLLLAGDNENDGTLTVDEIYDLHLPVDLATLSACETALGKVASGDDVVGFNRSFLYAGASSIVSSLWKVDDRATSILMQKFYASLNTTDKRSALRNAQMTVKNTYRSHPYYWAAFQLTGAVN